jgi:hypothetical protein
METSDSKSVKRLAKSLVLTTALLAVFACSFATIVLLFDDGNLKTIDDNPKITSVSFYEIIPDSGNDSLKTDGLETPLPYNEGLKMNVFILLCFLAILPLVPFICLFISFFGLKLLDFFLKKPPRHNPDNPPELLTGNTKEIFQKAIEDIQNPSKEIHEPLPKTSSR